MPVSTIPYGYHSVSPYLIVADVGAQIEFLHATFDAVDVDREEMARRSREQRPA